MRVSTTRSPFRGVLRIPPLSANQPKGDEEIDKRPPEASQLAHELASLALARVKQGGHLKLREREELRRVFASAAELLGWATIRRGPAEAATKDLLKLAKSGARLLTRELADEVADKKIETSQLEKVASSLHKLAKEADFADPIEISYSHTARKPPLGLVTKTETLILTDADEAAEAAQTIEAKRETWDKLRLEMLDDLGERQRQLDEMKRTLSAFLESSEGLVRHVMSTRY